MGRQKTENETARVMAAGAAVFLIALLLFCLISCGALVRENPIVRGLFYPPEVAGMELGIGPDTSGETFDHSDYGELLCEFVDGEGRVDYVGFESRSAALDGYIDRIAAVDRSTLSRHEQLALLLNAYNACTLRLILDHKGIASIRDIPEDSRWDDGRWVIGGENVSLTDLEHEWIRREFGEPRIHFALVCASTGCPRLRAEPYSGARLQEQLDDQARDFFSNSRNMVWDPAGPTLSVSEILDWYRSDFTADGISIAGYVARWVDEETLRSIRDARGEIELEFISYDWSLNGSWRSVATTLERGD